MRMTHNYKWREYCTTENYTDYLFRNCNHQSLVVQAMVLMRAEFELGDMAQAFADFFDDEEDLTLAKFVAANREPQYDNGFVSQCKESAEEENDPYAAKGIREDDFYKD